MRKAIILSMFLFSISSLAEITLQLVSGDYSVEATLKSEVDPPTHGSVSAVTSIHDQCMGNFVFDMSSWTLNITFDGVGGPGTGGGCHNEMMSIEITEQGYQKLLQGEEISVIFKSSLRFWYPQEAKVKIISGHQPE